MIQLHISKGNSKMGAVPSFSLPSGVTCSHQACKTCFKDCYWRRHVEARFPLVRKQSAHNLNVCQNALEEAEKYLNWYFDSPTSPRLFRIHVGGDFFNKEYFAMWVRVISSHPDTQFLAFTKQFDVIAEYKEALPENFSLVLSAWPGMDIPDDLQSIFPIAWMQDGTESRIPYDAIECGGNCGECGAKCWTLSGHDVVFNKH